MAENGLEIEGVRVKVDRTIDNDMIVVGESVANMLAQGDLILLHCDEEGNLTELKVM